MSVTWHLSDASQGPYPTSFGLPQMWCFNPWFSAWHSSDVAARSRDTALRTARFAILQRSRWNCQSCSWWRKEWGEMDSGDWCWHWCIDQCFVEKIWLLGCSWFWARWGDLEARLLVKGLWVAWTNSSMHRKICGRYGQRQTHIYDTLQHHTSSQSNYKSTAPFSWTSMLEVRSLKKYTHVYYMLFKVYVKVWVSISSDSLALSWMNFLGLDPSIPRKRMEHGFIMPFSLGWMPQTRGERQEFWCIFLRFGPWWCLTST